MSELSELRTENTKLKFRLSVLKNSIDDEKKRQMQSSANPTTDEPKSAKSQSFSANMIEDKTAMNSVLHSIKKLFGTAIREAYPQLTNAPLLVTRSDHADYQCNSALPLSKYIGGDKRLNPLDVANTLIKHLPPNPMMGEVAVARAGFINITLNKEFVSKSILNVVTNGVRVQSLADKSANNRVVIDYSAPNIAKEMHVG
ncbi:unnamed protein product, partial [Medioppia subpectinata]